MRLDQTLNLYVTSWALYQRATWPPLTHLSFEILKETKLVYLNSLIPLWYICIFNKWLNIKIKNILKIVTWAPRIPVKGKWLPIEQLTTINKIANILQCRFYHTITAQKIMLNKKVRPDLVQCSNFIVEVFRKTIDSTSKAQVARRAVWSILAPGSTSVPAMERMVVL